MILTDRMLEIAMKTEFAYRKTNQQELAGSLLSNYPQVIIPDLSTFIRKDIIAVNSFGGSL